MDHPSNSVPSIPPLTEIHPVPRLPTQQSSQMRGINPQTLNNGQFMPDNNMPPPMMMQQQPGPFNAPMMMPPQLNPGFLGNICSAVPMFMNQQMNFQQQGQLVLQLASLVQHLSQNGGLLNMSPNPMQNVNPSMLPLQMPNPNQVPNPNIFPNQMFGAGQQPIPHQLNFMMQQQQQQPMAANLSNSLPAANLSGPCNPFVTEQRPGNTCEIQQSFQPRSSSFPGQQGGNFAGMPQNSNTNSQWGNSRRKDFHHQSIKEGSQLRYNNSQFHPNDNKKRKFESKGRGHERPSKIGGSNPVTSIQAGENKRTFIPNYPEHEVKQWRELRKKNYPTKCNVDKKQAVKLADAEAIEKEAKMRREQLKEVLAKQAELGVEVAEVPSYYLLDSEKQVNHQEGDGRWQKKKGRFQQKRERRNKGGQKFGNQATGSHDLSGIAATNMKEPTLLQKLLSSDIKKDNQRLLQSFRFMAMNSFFKDWPGKPLSFPKVVVQEDGIVVKEDVTGTDIYQGGGDEEEHDDNDEEEQQMKAGKEIVVAEEEEGEIIN